MQDPQFVASSLTNENIRLTTAGETSQQINLAMTIVRENEYEGSPGKLRVVADGTGGAFWSCRTYTLTMMGGPSGVLVTHGERQYELSDDEGNPVPSETVTFAVQQFNGDACDRVYWPQ
ncbi:MAG: hypothetical protein HY465_01370 [Deltaproteobacteria bacterium]|nr:hypothetical protein [Deltaproteobacteria bacterium]